MEMLRRFVREEEGQDLTEYGMLVAFIAFVVLASVVVFGTELNDWWSTVGTNVGGWAPS